MADYKKLAPKILKWEGGSKYTEIKGDKGGATKYGITLDTWKNVGYDKNKDGKIDKRDVMLLEYEDFLKVFKKHYWDKCKGDDIKSQSIADIMIDWYWNSGKWGVVYPQRILGLKDDGIVGAKTIQAINSYKNQKELFTKIWQARKKYYNDIVAKNKTQKKFLTGWLNRLNDFGWIG